MHARRLPWIIGLLLSGVLTGSCAPPPATAASPVTLEDLQKELQAIRAEIEEQGRMLRLLYQFVDAETDLEEQAAELEREQALSLETLCEIEDAQLKSVGCADPSKPHFAVLLSTGGVRIFNRDGEVVEDLVEPGQHVRCMAYSPDGRSLLAGVACPEQGGLMIWDLDSREVTFSGEAMEKAPDRVGWLGRELLAYGSMVSYYDNQGEPANREQYAGGVRHARTGEDLWSFKSFIRDDFQSIWAAGDGRWLAVRDVPDQPRGAILLDGKSGERVRVLYDENHGSGPLSLCISPDNDMLAVGYAPCDIILWDPHTGKMLHLLEGHSNWVVSLAFSADGRRLVSGGGDGTVRLWDTASGEQLGMVRFSRNSVYVEGVGFTPDGKHMFATAQGHLYIIACPNL